MRKCVTLIAASLFVSTAAIASDSGLDDAIKTAGCGGCHSSDVKKVGPGMKSLGEKYKTSDAFLAAFHKNAMHKSVKASDADVKAVADHAIAGK